MEETDDETSEDEAVNRSINGENGCQANLNNATLLSSDNSSAYTRSWRMWKRKRKDNEETINGTKPVNNHHLSTCRKRYSTRKPISENSRSTSVKRQNEIEVRADNAASTSIRPNPNERRLSDVTFTYVNKNFRSKSNSEESLSKKLTRQLMQKSAGSRSVYFTPSNTGLDLRTGRSYGGSEKGQFGINQNSKASNSKKGQSSSKSKCKCAKCGRKKKSENFPTCSPSERYQSGSERPEVQSQEQEKGLTNPVKEKDPKTKQTKKEKNCPEVCPTLKRQNTGCNCKFKVQVKPSDSTKSPKEAKKDKPTSKDCLDAKSKCQCRMSSTRIPQTTHDGNAKVSEKVETKCGKRTPGPSELSCFKTSSKSKPKKEPVPTHQNPADQGIRQESRHEQQCNCNKCRDRSRCKVVAESIRKYQLGSTKREKVNLKANQKHESKDKENIAVSKTCTKTNCKCSKCGKRTPASSDTRYVETSPILAPKKEPLKEVKPEPTNKDPVDLNREQSGKKHPVKIKEKERYQSGSEKPKSHDQLASAEKQQVSRKPDKSNLENEPARKVKEEKDCPKICPVLKKSHTGCNCQIKVQLKPRDPSDTSPKGECKDAQPIETKTGPSKSKTSCQSKSCKGKKKLESTTRVEQPECSQQVKSKPSGQNTTCQCESCKKKKKPGKSQEFQTSPPSLPKEPVETQPVKLKPTDKTTPKPSKVVKETCPCTESQAKKDIPSPPPKEPVEIEPVKLKPALKPSKVVKETCPCIESQARKDKNCPPSHPKEPLDIKPVKLKPSCPEQNENTHRPACPCTKCKPKTLPELPKVTKETCPCIKFSDPCLKTKKTQPDEIPIKRKPSNPTAIFQRPRIPSRTEIGDPCSEDKDIHTYDCNCQTCRDPNVDKHPVEDQKKPWRLPWSSGHPVELKPKSTPVEIKPWRVSDIFRHPRIPSRPDIVKRPPKETCPCQEDKEKLKKCPPNEHPIESKRPPVSAIFQHPRIPGVIDKPAKMTCIAEKESCPCEKPEEPCRQRGGDLIKEEPVITKPENIANMLQRPRLHEIPKIPISLPTIPKWEKQEKCPCQEPKSDPVKTKASSCANILRHPRIPNHELNRTQSEPCGKEEVCQCQREKCEPIKMHPVRTKPFNFESVFQHPKLHPISGPQLPSLKCGRKPSKDCICTCTEEEPKPKSVHTKPWNFPSLFQNPRIPMTTSERQKRESCPCRDKEPRPCDKNDKPLVEPIETKPGSILNAFQRPRIPFIMPPKSKESCHSIQCPCEICSEKPVGESCKETERKIKDIVRTKRLKCYSLFQHPRIPGPMGNLRPPSKECSKEEECHCQTAERKHAGREPIKIKPPSAMCQRPRIPFIPAGKKSEEEFCTCEELEQVPSCQTCTKTETIRSSSVKTKTFDISKLFQRPRIPKGHCHPNSHGGHCTCTICQDQLECEQHTIGSGPKWQVQIPCEDRPKRRKPEQIKTKTWDILNILQNPRIPGCTGCRVPKFERKERCPCSERETTKQKETCPCQTKNDSTVHPTRRKPTNIVNILQKPRIPQAGFKNLEDHPSKCNCLICEDSTICKSQKGDGKSKSKSVCPSCISKLFSDVAKLRQGVVNTKPFLTSSLFQHPRIPNAPNSHSHRKFCDCNICQERDICETIYEKLKKHERQTDNRHYGGTSSPICQPNESQPILHQKQTHREQTQNADSCEQVPGRSCCCKNCQKQKPCRNRRPITEVISRQKEEDMKRKPAGEVVVEHKTIKDCKCQICRGSGLCKHGESIKTEPKLENTTDLRPSKKCKCRNCKKGAPCLKNCRHDGGANEPIYPPKETPANVAQINHVPEKTCTEKTRNCVCEKCQRKKCHGYKVTDEHHSKSNTQIAPVKESTCKLVESCKICGNRNNSTCPKDCPRPKKSEEKIKRVSSPVEVCKTGSRLPKKKESKAKTSCQCKSSESCLKKSHNSEENVRRKEAGQQTPHYSKAGPSESNACERKKSHQKIKCTCKLCKGGKMCRNVSFEKSKAEEMKSENRIATEGKCCTCPNNSDKVYCGNPNCKNRR